MNDHRWSVWLMPDQEHSDHYKSIITVLSNKGITKPFLPHVTLFGRIATEPRPLFSFFNKLAKNNIKISIDILHIKRGTPPWKSLYIQPKINPHLELLQKEIDRRLNRFRDYEFDPHLSLAYGNLDVSQEILDGISLDTTIDFSSVALVYTSDRIKDWKPIMNFQLKA